MDPASPAAPLPEPGPDLRFWSLPEADLLRQLAVDPGRGLRQRQADERLRRAVQLLLFYLVLLWLAVMLLVGNLLVLPLALLPARLRRPLVQSLISATFRLFLGGCCACGLMRLDLRELDALNARPGGLLMVANHPSMIDVFLVLSRVRHALCLMKADLGTNPFLAVGARLAGYVSNRHAEGLIQIGRAHV